MACIMSGGRKLRISKVFVFHLDREEVCIRAPTLIASSVLNFMKLRSKASYYTVVVVTYEMNEKKQKENRCDKAMMRISRINKKVNNEK